MTNCSHGTAAACGHHDGDDSCHGGHSHFGGARLQLTIALVAGGLLLAAWITRQFAGLDRPLIGNWAFSSLAIFASFLLAGCFAAVDAIHGLLARRFQIDFLMVVAALGAAAIGHADEGALLLVLFSLGHAAEHYAMGRARRTIESLAELRPSVATLWDPDSGTTRDVPADQLQVGQIIVVRPDSRIAADGVVVFGDSFVSQAEITGESVPVEKRPLPDGQLLPTDWSRLDDQHRLYAGTINGGGVLRLQVARTAANSTLSTIARLVTEARAHRSPTQRLAQQFERSFVPAVLLFVVLLPFAFLVIDEPVSDSIYRAITVLVAASPCALAIATPSAVLSGVARAGREGIVFKGGGPLENLGRVEVIAFDKTGTLTVGQPAVVQVVTAEGLEPADLLGLVAAVETLSDHPLAGAIVAAAKADPSNNSNPHAFTVENLQRVAGQGIHALVDGEPVWIGNRRLFDQAAADNVHPPAAISPQLPPPMPPWLDQAAQSLQQQGQTFMIVCYGNDYLGVIGLQDRPRAGAAASIQQLRQSGIRQIVILSGDHTAAVQAVAAQIGITDRTGSGQTDAVLGDLSPDDKWQWIRQQAAKQPVAMIGDGVNDAPALAAATVSVAMGGAGSEVALETADVVLMSDDLAKLPHAVRLSRQSARIIRQNLWISLGVIAVLVPAALLGMQLALAVVFHEGSTLVVVANALRLLRFR